MSGRADGLTIKGIQLPLISVLTVSFIFRSDKGPGAGRPTLKFPAPQSVFAPSRGPRPPSRAFYAGPRSPEDGPRWLQEAKMLSRRRPRRPKMAQEASEIAQKAPKKAQEMPKPPPNGPRDAKKHGKTYGFRSIFTIRRPSAAGAPRGPEMASRWPKMAPRRPQDGPNIAPRRSQEGLRAAQELSSFGGRASAKHLTEGIVLPPTFC